MSPDTHLQFHQLPLFISSRIPDVDIPFIEKEYYETFLQEIGVMEKISNTSYSLVSKEGKNWSICLEEVAIAILDMQTKGALTPQEALSILQFVIEKMDQNVIPHYVITYICREAVKHVVLRRFNEVIGESYSNLTELSYTISDHIEEANEIINSIRFCDPAIRSGHFLVSLMNEIIAVKSQLGVLADCDGNPLFRFRVETNNENELHVIDRKNFDIFKFKQADAESKRIRDTLLREKSLILDNCLFGFDIDHFSVTISQLRLWNEILKHVCWENDQIPNWPVFEGNIRCGNALMSRFPFWKDTDDVSKHIEFPKLLNESGHFIGFDCIVGNPPDSLSQVSAELSENSKQVPYNIYKCMGDVSDVYYESALSLLKPKYFLSYIISNSWTKSFLADKMPPCLQNETNPLLVVEFEKTIKQNNQLDGKGIMLLQKDQNRHQLMTCQIKDEFDPLTERLDDYIRQNSILFIKETEDTAVLKDITILNDVEKQIKAKIEKKGTSLVSWDIQMYNGIQTGCDNAFVIDGKTKDEFVISDYKNTDIVKPLLLGENIKRYKFDQSNLWLICIPWHFPLLYNKSIQAASEKAEERFHQQYPIIFNHLVKFRDQLLARNPKEVGVVYEWYTVQHFGTSNKWDDFTQPKIVWKKETPSPIFCLDYSGYAIMDTSCFMTGQHLKYLLGVLNSNHGRFMLREATRLSNGDMHINIPTLESLKIPIPNAKIESEMISLVNKRTSDAYLNEYNDIDGKINQLVYDMYELDTEERAYIDQLKIEN